MTIVYTDIKPIVRQGFQPKISSTHQVHSVLNAYDRDEIQLPNLNTLQVYKSQNLIDSLYQGDWCTYSWLWEANQTPPFVA